MKPYLSVILTTHNRPQYLERAIKSLLSQEYKNYEILLIADESSIGTKYVAANLLRPMDSFISIPGMRGPSESRNLGIQLAKGEWISFLDDDDAYENDYFDNAVKVLTRSKQVNYFNFKKIIECRSGLNPSCLSEKKVDLSLRQIDDLWISNFIPNNALFILSALARGHLINNRLSSHEDWDWLINLRESYEFIHHDIYGPLVYSDENSSRNERAYKNGSVVLDYLSIYRRWPAKNIDIKNKRSELLASMGLNLRSDFL